MLIENVDIQRILLFFLLLTPLLFFFSIIYIAKVLVNTYYEIEHKQKVLEYKYTSDELGVWLAQHPGWIISKYPRGQTLILRCMESYRYLKLIDSEYDPHEKELQYLQKLLSEKK